MTWLRFVYVVSTAVTWLFYLACGLGVALVVLVLTGCSPRP